MGACFGELAFEETNPANMKRKATIKTTKKCEFAVMKGIDYIKVLKKKKEK